MANEIEDEVIVSQLIDHIRLVKERCCISADSIDTFSIVHEKIEALSGIERVTELTTSSVEKYFNAQVDKKITIPLKAPAFSRRFSDEKKDYAKSNINVSYGRGRLNRRKQVYERRNWYETQITVSKEIWSLPEYPIIKPFYVVTDDGYLFEAHTTSANHKQVTAYGDDRIFGRWIKGRLVSSGLLTPFDNIEDDENRLGVVTAEMLERARMKTMILTKTNQKELGRVYKRKDNGRLDKSIFTTEPLDVWTISFSNEEFGE